MKKLILVCSVLFFASVAFADVNALIIVKADTKWEILWDYENNIGIKRGWELSKISVNGMRKIDKNKGLSPGMSENNLLFGTRRHKGKELLNYYDSGTLEELQALAIEEGWKILAVIEDGIPVIGYNPKDILPFMKDKIKYDEDGSIKSIKRPKVGSAKLLGRIQGADFCLSDDELIKYLLNLK